jgi:hypothetical protein
MQMRNHKNPIINLDSSILRMEFPLPLSQPDRMPTNNQNKTSLKTPVPDAPNFQIKTIISEPPVLVRAKTDAPARGESRIKINQKEIKQTISVYANQPTMSTIKRCPKPSAYHPAP